LFDKKYQLTGEKYIQSIDYNGSKIRQAYIIQVF